MSGSFMGIDEKFARLRAILREMHRAAVAFSGGVDSALLAVIAHEELGDENFVAVTIDSPLLAGCERGDAAALAGQYGLRHVLLKMNELADADIAMNSPERCYFCKKLRFTSAIEWARENHFAWVLDGSNIDDLGDYRPGMKALAELKAHVRSPFLEAGIGKQEIREMSRRMNLFTWDKPARACLASRVPYGTGLTREILLRVDKAEDELEKFFVANNIHHAQYRVRAHSDVARIEAATELMRAIFDHAGLICDALKNIGFKYVALDLDGYRMGSLNEVLQYSNKNKSQVASDKQAKEQQ